MRCIIFGGGGAGKTTLARCLLVDAPPTTRFIDGYAGEPLDRAGAWIVTVLEGGVMPSIADSASATIIYDHVGEHRFLVRLPHPPHTTYGPLLAREAPPLPMEAPPLPMEAYCAPLGYGSDPDYGLPIDGRGC